MTEPTNRSPEIDPTDPAQIAVRTEQLDLPERSMGISGDFVHTVGAGSTMVRLGTTLFGARPPR